MSAVPTEVIQPIRIDIGCGKNKKSGFVGFDSIAFDGVDVVGSVTVRWPWDDNSVDEVHCSHLLEHLTNLNDKWERIHFFNELYRVMKPGASCQLIIPHWASNRYYGDPTHKEPFSEMGFYYLDKGWRAVNAPHADAEHSPNGYACDFTATWGYSMHQSLQARNPEYQMHALTWFKDAAQDIIATLTKKK